MLVLVMCLLLTFLSFLDCPAGQYAESEESAHCKSCPNGWAQSATKSAACSKCLPGFYQNFTTCEACPSGYSSNKADVITQCVKCKEGKTSQARAHYCEDCAAGKYKKGSAAEGACVSCSNLYRVVNPDDSGQEVSMGWQNEEGQSTCKLCQGGEYSIETKCIKTSLAAAAPPQLPEQLSVQVTHVREDI